MAIICCIGVTIDDDNDPAPERFPEHQYQHQGKGQEFGEVWKSEAIIYPCKANNLHNYFAYFWNYTK